MCVSPRLLANGETISCRLCWQCRHARISDWVGRCIAEKKTSAHCHFVTLTYGGDDYYRSAGVDNVHAQTLMFEDVRNWLKRMRHVAPLRYLCAGEYGEIKGRAHWHVLCFWKEAPPPDLRLEVNYVHEAGGRKLWEHGWTYWKEMHTPSIRYTCKYILKDIEKSNAGRNRHFSLSTQPPLGYEYFQRLAYRYVESGLSPQDLIYRFSEEINPKTGKTLEFFLHRTSAAHFLDAFIDQWELYYGNDRWPQSDLIDEHIDATFEQRHGALAFDNRYFWLKSEEAKGRWHGAAINQPLSPKVNQYLRAIRGQDRDPIPGEENYRPPLVSNSSKT